MRFGFWALAATLLTATAMPAHADCVRHIYNNSKLPWTIVYTVNNGGSIWFTEDVGRPSGQTVFKTAIAPGQTLPVVFLGVSQGTVTIYDSSGDSRSFGFALKFFNRDCPYIDHDGRTGAVAVNDPADSDLHIWGADTWGTGG